MELELSIGGDKGVEIALRPKEVTSVARAYTEFSNKREQRAVAEEDARKEAEERSQTYPVPGTAETTRPSLDVNPNDYWLYHKYDPVSVYLADISTRQSVEDPDLTGLDLSKCDDLTLSVDPPPRRPPSQGACDGYDGVLHIAQYDDGGASGTAFFMYMVALLQYADIHNLKPWVHLNDFTWPIWDGAVFAPEGLEPISFTMQSGAIISNATDLRDVDQLVFPGKPVLPKDVGFTPQTYQFFGTGIWDHYFQPISDLVPDDPSCRDKPYVTLDRHQIQEGIHENAPYAPRGWRFAGGNWLMGDGGVVSWEDWFREQRKYAAITTNKYIRFNAEMEQRALCAFPHPRRALGLHIRHGDKWESREIIPVHNFLPYARAYVENGGISIYLATDSASVVEEIFEKWPDKVTSRIVRQSNMQGLSRNRKGAFEVEGVSKHRTNAEALTDILALSKSTYFVHGLSALSEAVFYLNPDLVERSVNLEVGAEVLDVGYFVKELLPRGKLALQWRRTRR